MQVGLKEKHEDIKAHEEWKLLKALELLKTLGQAVKKLHNSQVKTSTRWINF